MKVTITLRFDTECSYTNLQDLLAELQEEGRFAPKLDISAIQDHSLLRKQLPMTNVVVQGLVRVQE